jgi:hypothetical protein
MVLTSMPPSLNEAIKGNQDSNPNPGTASLFTNPQILSHPPIHHPHHDVLKPPRPPQPPSDPTSLLPSSPPQIYLNLLIMEASLRSQYLTLRARRRQNTFVLTLLAGWIFFFTYLLWLRPRDDGKGIGGSQYWLLDMMQKVCFITGVVTALLFWATGQWERGVRWPRRWIGIANRGLRGMNAKIVVIRGPWYEEARNWLAFVKPFEGGLWGGETGGSSYHFINLGQEKREGLGGGSPRITRIEQGKEYAEEDIAPGGDYLKLLLLPKPFTSEFRQNWETYRTEYWYLENERRAELRKRVRARQREIAREEGGMLWWTGWRGWKRARGITARPADVEKSGLHPHGHNHTHSHSHSLTSNPGLPRKRRPSTLRDRDGSHSRSSSRSTTPTPDIDDRLRISTAASEHRERRWSTSTTGSTSTRPDSRRGPSSSSSSTATLKKSVAPGTAQSARRQPGRLASSGSAAGSRPGTPSDSPNVNVNMWQSKRGSTLSQGESASDWRDGEFEAPAPLLVGKRRRSREGGEVFPNAPSA